MQPHTILSRRSSAVLRPRPPRRPGQQISVIPTGASAHVGPAARPRHAAQQDFRFIELFGRAARVRPSVGYEGHNDEGQISLEAFLAEYRS